MQNLKEILKKYKKYILISIIVILIIIIGFIYSDKTTIKYEETKIEVEEKKEEKELSLIKVDIKGEINKPGVYEMNENDRIFDVINKANGLTYNANTDYLNLSKKISDEMVIIIYSNDEIKEYQKSLIKEDNIKEPEVIEKEIIKYEVIEKEIPCPNTTNNACIDNKNTSNTKESSKSIINNEKSNEEIEASSEEIKEDKATNNQEINNDNLININFASKEELMTLTGIGESKADLIIDYRNEQLFETIDDIKNVKGIGDSLFEKIKDYITT